MTKRSPGRPSKLTPQVKGRLVQAIKLGATYEHACNFAGIAYSTFRSWMVRGEKAKTGEFLNFLEAIKDAEGAALVGWLAMIEKAAQDGDWKASAWKAERRYPKDYGRKSIVEISEREIQDEYAEIIAALEAGGTTVQVKKEGDQSAPSEDLPN